jgi:hypothetical protein
MIEIFSQLGGVDLCHVETTVVPHASAGDPAGDLITEDAIIHTIIISNYGGQASPKITVQDRASTPRPFGFGASTIVGTGGAIMFESEKGVPATSGLNAVCDTASACTVKVVWRRRG